MSGCLHAFLNFSFLKFMKCMLEHKKKIQIIITFSGQIFAFWHWEDFKWFTWWKVVLKGWKGKDEGISRVTSLVNFDCYMVSKVKFSLPPSLVTNYSTTILHTDVCTFLKDSMVFFYCLESFWSRYSFKNYWLKDLLKMSQNFQKKVHLTYTFNRWTLKIVR